jgi:hypothetical protein
MYEIQIKIILNLSKEWQIPKNVFLSADFMTGVISIKITTIEVSFCYMGYFVGKVALGFLCYYFS